jgi:hypothetical protein
MRTRVICITAAVAVGAALPATGSAKTYPDSFQMVQYTPSRVWQETSGLPFGLPTSLGRIYRYTLGGSTFVGAWHPASVGVLDASEALAREYRAVTRFATVPNGVIVDRKLTAVEQQRFKQLADLYRDADVLVVAAAHPACAGITRAQARAIATGGIRQWSQVVTGASGGAIRVRHLVDGFGAGVPHLGAKWIGKLNKWRVNYAPGAQGAPDGGVSAAAGGDQSIAAITTWSRVRLRRAGTCVVPLDEVAPSDATVVGLTYPEAFPVTYVVTRKLSGRSVVARARSAVHRRAMGEFLNSERAKALLRRQGLLVTGDALPPA